ncbi:hypothetical protein [Reyranella sp.]
MLRDVEQEKLSVAAALRDYGIVVDPTGPTVDEVATTVARAARR